MDGTPAPLVPNLRYEVLGPLGEGAYGRVYLGRDLQLQREVAIKFLSPSAAQSVDILDQARALARVGHHQNVVEVYGVEPLSDPQSGAVVEAIVMERVHGDPLARFLNSGGVGPAEARVMGQGLIDGLRHIHRCGVPHGDIHSENVLIATSDQRPRYIDIHYWDSLGALSTMSRETKLGADVRALVRLLVEILHTAAPSLKRAADFDSAARHVSDVDVVERLFLEALEPEPPSSGEGGGPTDDVPPDAPAPRGESGLHQKLVSWVQARINRWENLTSTLPTDHPGRMPHGRWCASYLISDLRLSMSLTDLQDVLVKVKGHETGWPPWWVPTRKGIAPYRVDGEIECWLGKDGTFLDPAHADYWRAAPSGMFLLIRGFQEDGRKEFEPGTVFDLTLPIWRTAECLLHAARMGAQVGKPDALVLFRMEWSGLQGRILKSWAEPARYLDDEHRARTDRIVTETRRPIRNLESELVAAVNDLVRPLYEAFDFFSLPPEMIEQELKKLLLRRF